MAGVMNGGTGGASNPQDGTPYIGKTGTTDESIHTWMVGTSTTVATAVWVGNIKGDQAMRNIRVNGQSGGVLRHRIFKPIAQAIDACLRRRRLPRSRPGTAHRFAGRGAERDRHDAGSRPSRRSKRWPSSSTKTAGRSTPTARSARSRRPIPAPARTVSRGTTVSVYTSNGLAEEVPNVVGMNRNAAEEPTRSRGLLGQPSLRRCGGSWQSGSSRPALSRRGDLAGSRGRHVP